MTNTTLPVETFSDSDLAQMMLDYMTMKGGLRPIASYAARFHIGQRHARLILESLVAGGKAVSVSYGRNRQFGLSVEKPVLPERYVPKRGEYKSPPEMREKLDEIQKYRELYPSKHL